MLCTNPVSLGRGRRTAPRPAQPGCHARGAAKQALHAGCAINSANPSLSQHSVLACTSTLAQFTCKFRGYSGGGGMSQAALWGTWHGRGRAREIVRPGKRLPDHAFWRCSRRAWLCSARTLRVMRHAPLPKQVIITATDLDFLAQSPSPACPAGWGCRPRCCMVSPAAACQPAGPAACGRSSLVGA